MLRTELRGLVESCVIVAEVDDEKHYFNVEPEFIEEATKIISTTFAYFNKPCSRVYITGFKLVSSSTNLTKEKLVERVGIAVNWRQSRIVTEEKQAKRLG